MVAPALLVALPRSKRPFAISPMGREEGSVFLVVLSFCRVVIFSCSYCYLCFCPDLFSFSSSSFSYFSSSTSSSSPFLFLSSVTSLPLFCFSNRRVLAFYFPHLLVPKNLFLPHPRSSKMVLRGPERPAVLRRLDS